jgi:hypothetical protein
VNTSFDTSIDITLGSMSLPLENESLLWSDLCHKLARKVERGGECGEWAHEVSGVFIHVSKLE